MFEISKRALQSFRSFPSLSCVNSIHKDILEISLNPLGGWNTSPGMPLSALSQTLDVFQDFFKLPSEDNLKMEIWVARPLSRDSRASLLPINSQELDLFRPFKLSLFLNTSQGMLNSSAHIRYQQMRKRQKKTKEMNCPILILLFHFP